MKQPDFDFIKMKLVYFLLVLAIHIPLKAQMKDSLRTQIFRRHSIDEYISNVKVDEHRTMLLDFIKGRDSLTKMRIEKETSKYYEIWVDHITEDGRFWAEAYWLSKEDGTIEMIWHEHPNKTNTLNIEFEKLSLTDRVTKESIFEKPIIGPQPKTPNKSQVHSLAFLLK